MQLHVPRSPFASDANMVNLLDCRSINSRRIAIEFPNNIKHRLQHPQVLLQHVALERSWVDRGFIVIVAISEHSEFVVP